GTGGRFYVSGSHVYALSGSYSVTVTVTDADGSSASTSDTITVADALEAIGANLTTSSFSTTDTSAVAGDFTATIDWGDGTDPSSGTTSGGSGLIIATGDHTFDEGGTFGTGFSLTGLAGLVTLGLGGADAIEANEADARPSVEVVHPINADFAAGKAG